MGRVIFFEAEGLFDSILIHGNVADTIHQAAVPAAEVHPQLAGQTVRLFIHPLNGKNAENILVPKAGGIEADFILK